MSEPACRLAVRLLMWFRFHAAASHSDYLQDAGAARQAANTDIDALRVFAVIFRTDKGEAGD